MVGLGKYFWIHLYNPLLLVKLRWTGTDDSNVKGHTILLLIRGGGNINVYKELVKIAYNIHISNDDGTKKSVCSKL